MPGNTVSELQPTAGLSSGSIRNKMLKRHPENGVSVIADSPKGMGISGVERGGSGCTRKADRTGSVKPGAERPQNPMEKKEGNV